MAERVVDVGDAFLPADLMWVAVSRQLVERFEEEHGDDWSEPVQLRLSATGHGDLADMSFRYAR